MGTWPVQDAKAGVSELLDTCLAEAPQRVTRRGIELARHQDARKAAGLSDQAQRPDSATRLDSRAQ